MKFPGLFFASAILVFVSFTPNTFPQAPVTSPAKSSGHAACSVDNSEPTEADKAYFHGAYKKAADLYAADYAKDHKDLHARLGQIDSLIELHSIINTTDDVAIKHALDDATRLVDSWTATSATDTHAILAAADLRYALGDRLEAYALAVKAQAADPCLGPAYQTMAAFEESAGYRVTARKHLNTAHQLSPKNMDIRFDWIYSLDFDHALEELKKYYDEVKDIPEKRRKALLDRLARIQAEKDDRCELVSSNGPAIIPMVPLSGRGSIGIRSYGINVSFGGKTRTLRIDTGASGLLLSKSASGGLSLVKVDTARVGGFGDEGANSSVISNAPSVEIGGLKFKNCLTASLANFSVLGGGGLDEKLDETDGLIGPNLFERYLVTLDYVKHEIHLDPLPKRPETAGETFDPLGGSNNPEFMVVDRTIDPSLNKWTKIYRDDHLLLIPTIIDSKRHLFIADSGADSNLIDTDFARTITTVKDSIMVSRGLSGTTNKMYETGGFTMDFAGLRLPIKGMDAQDLSRFEGVSGFIGYPTLEQLVMHIDYRDNLMLMEAPGAGKK